MEYSYTYSITNDTITGFDASKLGDFRNTIFLSLNTIKYINTYGDDLIIFFTSEITGTDKTDLDTIVNNYIYVEPIVQGDKTVRYDINQSNIKGINWVLINTFDFPGSIINNVTHIKFLGKLINGTSYDVKIFDYTNDTTICTQTFTNTNTEILDMGTISNIPTTDVIFEVHVKCDAEESKCSSETINIFYN